MPIPGTTKRLRLDENVNAASVALCDDDLARIDAAVPRVPVQVARYCADRQRFVGR